jgi:hypothetical protein
MLRKIGMYNNFPAGYEPAKLKQGEVAVYRLLISNNDPVRGTTVYPKSFKIRSVDRVKIGDEWVDVGLVRSVNREGVVETVRYVSFNDNANKKDGGYLRLTGGNADDEEVFEYMEICNFNESNPNRDPSITPLFVKLDDKKDAKDDRGKRSLRLKAMTLASDMTLGEAKDFTAARGWNQDDEEDILRGRIEKFAETDPEGFIKAFGDKNQATKTTIKNAMDKGVIKHNVPDGKIVWGNGETIYVLPKPEGINPIDEFADFIASNTKKAKTVFEQIEKELNAEEVTV